MSLSYAAEAALMDSAAGYGRSLYLRPVVWLGAHGQGSGKEVNGDGTFPTNVGVSTDSGFVPVLVTAAAWAAAVGGAPTTKQVPKSGGSALAWVATDGDVSDIIGYVWTSDANAVTVANYVGGGVILDTAGNPMSTDKAHGSTFSFTSAKPIIEYFGRTPPGTNPT